MFWRQQRKTATRKLVSVSWPFTSPFSYSGRKVPNIEESSIDVCHRFGRTGVRLKSKETIFRLANRTSWIKNFENKKKLEKLNNEKHNFIEGTKSFVSESLTPMN